MSTSIENWLLDASSTSRHGGTSSASTSGDETILAVEGPDEVGYAEPEMTPRGEGASLGGRAPRIEDEQIDGGEQRDHEKVNSGHCHYFSIIVVGKRAVSAATNERRRQRSSDFGENHTLRPSAPQ